MADLDAGLLTVSWQLQPLLYLDKHDRSAGFRIPDDYEARQPAGCTWSDRRRTPADAPFPFPWAVETLSAWRAVAPDNPHGLVWTRPEGRPVEARDDLHEWHVIQDEAGVRHHPNIHGEFPDPDGRRPAAYPQHRVRLAGSDQR